MTAFTFDAIEHLKRLKQDGFSEAQAESVIKMVRDVQETNLSFITTKADVEKLDNKIDSVKAELKADIRELELRIDNKVAQLETKIAQGTATTVKWIAAVLVLQVLSPLVQSILPLFKAH